MRATDDTFVPLAQWLRPGTPHDVVAACALPEAQTGLPLATTAAAALPAAPADLEELARDVRLFRARLTDALDAAQDRLLREVAYAVLGRELLLAPADIAAVAARIVAEHPGAQPLRLRVAPGDAAAARESAAGLPPLLVDAELAPGDAILEFVDCHIDARLAVRLSVLLESAA